MDELFEAGSGTPEPTVSLASLPVLVENLYRTLAAEKLMAREQSGRVPLTPRQVTAAIRMFVSAMG